MLDFDFHYFPPWRAQTFFSAFFMFTKDDFFWSDFDKTLGLATSNEISNWDRSNCEHTLTTSQVKMQPEKRLIQEKAHVVRRKIEAIFCFAFLVIRGNPLKFSGSKNRCGFPQSSPDKLTIRSGVSSTVTWALWEAHKYRIKSF